MLAFLIAIFSGPIKKCRANNVGHIPMTERFASPETRGWTDITGWRNCYGIMESLIAAAIRIIEGVAAQIKLRKPKL